MRITRYTIYTDKPGINIRAACIADLHSHPYNSIIESIKKISPDVILLPGDIVEVATEYMEERNRYGLDFLREAVKLAPTFYTYGNHEIYYTHAKPDQPNCSTQEQFESRSALIRSFGVHILNDSYEHFTSPRASNAFSVGCGVSIGGLVCGRDKNPELSDDPIDKIFLHDFSALQGYKILLCHYPHYYKEYLNNTNVDLILSGHAHGGQWRIFGRGVYAPHQGLFPKYTSGLHEGRLLISRGASNNLRLIPRFFNPCEVLDIRILSK